MQRHNISLSNSFSYNIYAHTFYTTKITYASVNYPQYIKVINALPQTAWIIPFHSTVYIYCVLLRIQLYSSAPWARSRLSPAQRRLCLTLVCISNLQPQRVLSILIQSAPALHALPISNTTAWARDVPVLNFKESHAAAPSRSSIKIWRENKISRRINLYGNDDGGLLNCEHSINQSRSQSLKFTLSSSSRGLCAWCAQWQ